VEVNTDYATIKALVNNTDFVVCQGKELTCVATLSGEAQVEAQGEVVTIREGEATYVFPGQHPQPAICADVAVVQAWLDEERGTETPPPLGKLVMGWPQQPCRREQPVATEVPAATADLPSAADMVQIPAGTYTIGRAAVDDYHVAPQQIPVPEFWIDRYEVTNAQYQAFVADTGHPAPPGDPAADR
jgi:formylglycine-generating enzyme required for sulfatase activity